MDRGLSKDGSGVVAAIGGEPDQLDPHRTSAYFSFEVLENTFDTLVEPDEDLTMRPALAERWKVSEDRLTWTFTLREGVTWHDGSNFGADDVVYSFRRIIDEKLGNAWRFDGVEDISAPDDSTVVIKLKRPVHNLLSRIGGHKGLAIVNKKNVESGKIKTHPVGTGPFSFDDYNPGESIGLEANPRWWGGAPQVPSLTFRFIPEPTTAARGHGGRGDQLDGQHPAAAGREASRRTRPQARHVRGQRLLVSDGQPEAEAVRRPAGPAGHRVRDRTARHRPGHASTATRP